MPARFSKFKGLVFDFATRFAVYFLAIWPMARILDFQKVGDPYLYLGIMAVWITFVAGCIRSFWTHKPFFDHIDQGIVFWVIAHGLGFWITRDVILPILPLGVTSDPILGIFALAFGVALISKIAGLIRFGSARAEFHKTYGRKSK